MKLFYLSLVFVSVSVFQLANAQDVVVAPKKVVEIFNLQYGNATQTEWKKFGKKNYKVEFEKEGFEYEAFYTAEGKWIKTEKGLSDNSLPAEIENALHKTRFRKWKLSEVEEVKTPKNELLYKVEMEKGNKEKNLYFLPEGKRIKACKL